MRFFLKLSIFAIAVAFIVGIPFMSHNKMEEHNNCLAAILVNANCISASILNFSIALPPAANPLEVFSIGLFIIVLFLFFPKVGFGEAKFELDGVKHGNVLVKFLRWISLREKRDPSPIFSG